MPEMTVRIGDNSGHLAAVSSDGRVVTTPLPESYQFYFHTIFDVPGVVAANTFLSIFNPVGSGKTISFYAVNPSSYTIGASSTPNSMVVDRITAASGGTLIAAANINKLYTATPNSIAEVRVSNPTVTKTGLTLDSWPPPLSTGAGQGSTTYSVPPPGQGFTCLPGQGIAFSTAAGNTNQVWSLNVNWAEY